MDRGRCVAHGATTLEHNALFDEKLRRFDIAVDATGRVNLDQFGGAHIASDSATLDDQGANLDCGLDFGALADDQHALADDLAMESTVDSDPALEKELTLIAGAGSEKGMDLLCAGRIVVDHHEHRTDDNEARQTQVVIASQRPYAPGGL